MDACTDAVRVSLSNGGVALIDAELWESEIAFTSHDGAAFAVTPSSRTWRRTTHSKWQYAVINLTRRPKKYACSMHRLVMRAQPGTIVDHINGDRFDNRRVNLRFCTNAENLRNMAIRGGSSRYKGVHLCPTHRGKKKWRAQINRRGRRTFLGYFRTEAEAARCYDFAAVECFGEFARLNFPLPATTTRIGIPVQPVVAPALLAHSS
ncbi:MAG: endonuclease [bacterium]|nr:endonuclease [bacterium]